MARKRVAKSSRAVFERVLAASTLSLAEAEKLSPALIEAVACMLWNVRWGDRDAHFDDRDAWKLWKLWKLHGEDVRGSWQAVARRALSLIFGLKVSGRSGTARQSRARRLGSP